MKFAFLGYTVFKTTHCIRRFTWYIEWKWIKNKGSFKNFGCCVQEDCWVHALKTSRMVSRIWSNNVWFLLFCCLIFFYWQLICFLYWMACGCSYRVAGGFMGFSRFTVRNIIHKMLDIFVNLRHLINHGTIDGYDRLQRKFCKRARSQAFNKFVGAIDGTHIRIQCPKNKRDEYINHKGYYSIQVQAVADSDGKFTDVFVGFPGSVHDNRVLRNSPLFI